MKINSPNQPQTLLPELVAALCAGKCVALLTLVGIEGSAPYPIGSQMLVYEDGRFTGQITGGCAEVALAHQAVLAMQQNENQIHRFGLGSQFFDIQLPCGSGIDVLFDVTTSWQQYQQQLDSIEQRIPIKSAPCCQNIIFEKHYLPTSRLVLFGQGPILGSLAKQALSCGFEVVAFVQGEADHLALAKADIDSELLCEFDEKITLSLDRYCGVVSLFHEHEREPQVLQAALNSEVFYIGALGSRRTHQQRLSALRARGISQQQLDRIYGPVGLNIGAQTPSQIAISILAQVIEHMPKEEQSGQRG